LPPERAQADLLLPAYADGRAVLVNFKRSTVLHHFNFKKPVRDIKFSPDGKCVYTFLSQLDVLERHELTQAQPRRFIAATHGSQIQVWQTPSHLAREFAPFVLHRTYTGHYDDVLSITWSSDSRCVRFPHVARPPPRRARAGP